MLDVLLFSEPVAPGDQLMPHLFPVNSLRCLVNPTVVGQLMQNRGSLVRLAMYADKYSCLMHILLQFTCSR